MSGLTQRQADLLAFIRRYVIAHGVSPHFEEMRQAMAVSSKSTIHRFIVQLEARGFIRRHARSERGIELVEAKVGGTELPGPEYLSRCAHEDLHRLRRDLAMEISRRTNDKAIARADAITGFSA